MCARTVLVEHRPSITDGSIAVTSNYRNAQFCQHNDALFAPRWGPQHTPLRAIKRRKVIPLYIKSIIPIYIPIHKYIIILYTSTQHYIYVLLYII